MNHKGTLCPTQHLHKFLIIFLCILSISLSGIAKPKEEYSLPVPPTPTPDRVEVFVGETKTITLKASGRIEEPIKFLIRKKPSKGTLGHIKTVDSKTAKVDYTSDPGSKVGEDSFTYAAQSIDSPVSAAARMEIDLRLRPAVLVYPRHLDFGTVPLGDSKQIDLAISNAGGKAAALEMSINSPWRIAAPLPNGVAAGSELLIALVFEPRSPGDFSERLAITRDGSEVVALRGSGIGALSWPSRGLLISSEMRAGAQAMIPFTNYTAADRIVEFEWPKNIIAPRALGIPAGETMQVPVALDISTPPSFSTRSMVPFRSGNFTASFPIIIEPAPAGFAINPHDVLELGKISLRETAAGKFAISNPGGQPTGLRAEIPQGLSVRPDPSGVLIGPGMSQEFEVSFRPEKSGPFRHFLSIGPENGEMKTLIIQGESRAALRVEKLLDIPTPPSPAAAPTPPVAAIPPVEECFLEKATLHSVTIRWKLTSPDTKDFLVERRVIRSGPEGRVFEQWEPWRQVEIRINGDTATAHFRKLAPGTFWNIRLRGIDSKGLAGPPTPGHFRIETQPINPWNIPFWIWMPASLAFASGVAWLVKKRIRFMPYSNLESRITELEK